MFKMMQHNNGPTSLLAISTRPPLIGHIGIGLVIALLSACAQPLLNSERIERQFGSYGIKVLEASASQRITNLYSMDGARQICRTLALVRFEDPQNPAISVEHEQITSGGSIGAVFKKHGWTVHKINLHIGTLTATAAASRISDLMNIRLPAELGIHIYRFQLRRGHERIDYAIISEIHHPDYLSAKQIALVYGRFPTQAISSGAMAAIEAKVQHALLQ